ncbi:hypothetical protein A3J78_01470 [Candidatus Beckwithbacteria bacterium RBG_13_35_6]|uniref:Uncharacterized protein n=1 Tax=Candidatus Beckwithbacteria bacterium RBG_13_35_6 TaxID=1797456 RepID=A0A1F5DD74_9BACT|nr:MAG: hypothetical protein A3J78_01470 [Candidatus Beckwithbacteria bacterium RBG_13_35_6]
MPINYGLVEGPFGNQSLALPEPELQSDDLLLDELTLVLPFDIQQVLNRAADGSFEGLGLTTDALYT